MEITRDVLEMLTLAFVQTTESVPKKVWGYRVNREVLMKSDVFKSMLGPAFKEGSQYSVCSFHCILSTTQRGLLVLRNS